MKNCNPFINIEERTVFQRRNNVILSTLKQHQNLTLKQQWFWVDTKTNFVLLYQQTQHVESMSKFRRHLNIDEFLCHFDMLFWCNSDRRIINFVLMYIFDIILMHGWSTQLQRASFFFFERQNIVVLLYHLLISFRYFIYESRFAVSFQCNLISLYFFNETLFHLEIFYVIRQCLRTVTTVDICSDLVCLQSQWFSTDVLWKFSGNGQRRRPFSVSCNNVFLQIFSLVESCCIEIRVFLPATLQKELPQVSFLSISRKLSRGVFKLNEISKMEFIPKIVYVFKSFEYFL